MNIAIIETSRTFVLYGLSKRHEESKAFSKEIIELMDPLWIELRQKNISHTGINHVVYDIGNTLFAGVETVGSVGSDTDLTRREFAFGRYAYCKHVGPYSGLENTYGQLRAELETLGEAYTHPLLEIYGHWQEDESRLETEILYTLK